MLKTYAIESEKINRDGSYQMQYITCHYIIKVE